MKYSSLFLISVILISILTGCSSEDRNKKSSVDETKIDEPLVEEEEYFDNQNFDLLVQQYEDPSRGRWQNPEYVIKKLGSLEGKVVADIGVGTGYFSFRIAETAEKVIAIDIDQRFLDYIEELKLEREGPENEKIVTRLALKDDPLLAQAEVDIALIVNTYHFLSNRVGYLRRTRAGMKPGGRLVLVDFKQGQMPVGPPEEYKVQPAEVMNELRKAGFDNVAIDNSSLQFQYIITAEND